MEIGTNSLFSRICQIISCKDLLQSNKALQTSSGQRMHLVIWLSVNIATPFPKPLNPRYYIVPPSDPVCPFDTSYLFIFNKHNYMQSEKLDHGGGGEQSCKKKIFLNTMKNTKTQPFIQIFHQRSRQKSKAYSLMIIGMMYLQKILLSLRMLRIHFFHC